MDDERRNPPAPADELRQANEFWDGEPAPYKGWRANPTITFWVGIAIGACIPFLIGILTAAYLLVNR